MLFKNKNVGVCEPIHSKVHDLTQSVSQRKILWAPLWVKYKANSDKKHITGYSKINISLVAIMLL